MRTIIRNVLFFSLFSLIAFSAKGQVVAGFTADVTSGCAPLVVHFTNTSTEPPPTFGILEMPAVPPQHLLTHRAVTLLPVRILVLSRPTTERLRHPALSRLQYFLRLQSPSQHRIQLPALVLHSLSAVLPRWVYPALVPTYGCLAMAAPQPLLPMRAIRLQTPAIIT